MSVIPLYRWDGTPTPQQQPPSSHFYEMNFFVQLHSAFFFFFTKMYILHECFSIWSKIVHAHYKHWFCIILLSKRKWFSCLNQVWVQFQQFSINQTMVCDNVTDRYVLIQKFLPMITCKCTCSCATVNIWHLTRSTQDFVAILESVIPACFLKSIWFTHFNGEHSMRILHKLSKKAEYSCLYLNVNYLNTWHLGVSQLGWITYNCKYTYKRAQVQVMHTWIHICNWQ